MSDAKRTPTQISPPISKPAAPDSAQAQSGRAKFDSRGNAVWEWKTETGNYSVDINTQRLKKLEAPELSLEETARAKRPKGLSIEGDAMPGGGFNPYDKGTVGTQPRISKPLRPTKPGVIPARKPVKDLRRLQQWMEMKKRLANQKDDD